MREPWLGPFHSWSSGSDRFGYLFQCVSRKGESVVGPPSAEGRSAPTPYVDPAVPTSATPRREPVAERDQPVAAVALSRVSQTGSRQPPHRRWASGIVTLELEMLRYALIGRRAVGIRCADTRS